MKIIKKTVVIIETDEEIFNRLRTIISYILIEKGNNPSLNINLEWLKEVDQELMLAVDENGKSYWK